MKKTYETGLQGEKTAEEYLTLQKGMICVERRLRNKCGEIDLIMLDGETVVFVEVKTRLTGSPGIGLSAVNKNKQQRLFKAASLFLISRKMLNRPVRFDLVEVTDTQTIHIPNAFQPGGLFFH